MNSYMDFEIQNGFGSPLGEIRDSIEEWMRSTHAQESSDFFRIRDQINQQLESQL